jgi:RNA polymerase sigma-70 factor (ECF subfamily)
MSVAEAEVLRAMHDAHAGAVWGFVLGLVGGDRARAEDVVQETFLRAWRSPRVLAGPPTAARNWLFTVARRIVIDEWRAGVRRPESVTAQVPEQPYADPTAQIVERQLMVTALRTLSPEHRQVLVTCYYRGASLSEAAQLLELPLGTVKSRLHYALIALRAGLEQLGGAV